MAKTLMDLPAEIRCMIYERCESVVPTHLTPMQDKSVIIGGREVRNGCLYIDCCCKPCMRKLADPAIMRVSRTIRAETTAIYYGSNKFFINTSMPIKWVEKITPYVRFMTDAIMLGQNTYHQARFVDLVLSMGLDVVRNDGYGGVRSKKAVVSKPLGLSSSSNAAVPAVFKTE